MRKEIFRAHYGRLEINVSGFYVNYNLAIAK